MDKKNLLENLMEKDHLGNLDAEGRTLLRVNSNN
jgi:hypothetical protein